MKLSIVLDENVFGRVFFSTWGESRTSNLAGPRRGRNHVSSKHWWNKCGDCVGFHLCMPIARAFVVSLLNHKSGDGADRDVLLHEGTSAFFIPSVSKKRIGNCLETRKGSPQWCMMPVCLSEKAFCVDCSFIFFL